MELLEQHYDVDHRARKMVEEGKVTSNFFVILMMVVNISTWMVIALTC